MREIIEVTYTVKVRLHASALASDDLAAEHEAMERVSDDPASYVKFDGSNLTVTAKWIDE